MPPLHRIPRHPVTLAMVAYRTWYRLPPAQRRQVVEAAKAHGPKIATLAAATARRTVGRAQKARSVAAPAPSRRSP